MTIHTNVMMNINVHHLHTLPDTLKSKTGVLILFYYLNYSHTCHMNSSSVQGAASCCVLNLNEPITTMAQKPMY